MGRKPIKKAPLWFTQRGFFYGGSPPSLGGGAGNDADYADTASGVTVSAMSV